MVPVFAVGPVVVVGPVGGVVSRGFPVGVP